MNFEVHCLSCMSLIRRPIQWFKEEGNHCPTCQQAISPNMFRWDVAEAENIKQGLMKYVPAVTNISFESANPAWPDGKPLRSEVLDDRSVRYVMQDGREIWVTSADYRLDYLSTWIGAKDDETYPIDLSIIGMSFVKGFFEVWNFDINEVRNYAFRKSMRITDLQTGEIVNGEDIEPWLATGGARRLRVA